MTLLLKVTVSLRWQDSVSSSDSARPRKADGASGGICRSPCCEIRACQPLLGAELVFDLDQYSKCRTAALFVQCRKEPVEVVAFSNPFMYPRTLAAVDQV